MSGFDDAIQLMNDGLQNKNIGVPFRNCPRLTQHIYGTRKSTYYLYGAETGLGKTKFVRDQHMFAVYDYYKKINDESKFDVRFLDFSLEVTKGENTANAIIRKIYIDHGKLISFERFMGFNEKYKLTQEEQNLILATRPYFKDLEKKMVVVEGEITPTYYHDVLLTHFRRHGKFEKDDGSMAVSRLGSYVPNNPQLMTVSIFDTINLSDNEKGQTDKQSIDRISKISINFRNICEATPIIVQQFNADNSDIQRQRHGVITPMLRDFEDSKRTTKDANVVIGLWSPVRYNKETVQVGKTVYDITQLRNWYVSAHLLKHRNGQSLKVVPLRFLGATSMFEELPLSMGPMDYARITKY
jgi:replicative DNA helicase